MMIRSLASGILVLLCAAAVANAQPAVVEGMLLPAIAAAGCANCLIRLSTVSSISIAADGMHS
jgi:hypothetical protein